MSYIYHRTATNFHISTVSLLLLSILQYLHDGVGH